MKELEIEEIREKESRDWEGWCGVSFKGVKWGAQLDALGWGWFFLWGGLVLLAETTNYSANFGWWDGWGVFFTGTGVIVLIGAFIRLLIPELRSTVVGNLVLGFILLGVGLGDWGWIWPLALIAIGLTIALGSLAKIGRE